MRNSFKPTLVDQLQALCHLDFLPSKFHGVTDTHDQCSPRHPGENIPPDRCLHACCNPSPFSSSEYWSLMLGPPPPGRHVHNWDIAQSEDCQDRTEHRCCRSRCEAPDHEIAYVNQPEH